ncbi:amine oxidase [Plasmodium yoelii]|uniref:Lysine-specific histone demethylase, putative n=1 Tax=Plasmodium yoelii TaxID=5861 RepID=A0A4V0KPI1_PLAYE|nr:amine oxidase [Plasmodium yoelii]VTZ80116.1 lysine-specific histone demethylase, putative [Plasmodium yoelii]|eukprot:XP_730508.2 amine oxidase [Plasmodium yoelii]
MPITWALNNMEKHPRGGQKKKKKNFLNNIFNEKTSKYLSLPHYQRIKFAYLTNDKIKQIKSQKYKNCTLNESTHNGKLKNNCFIKIKKTNNDLSKKIYLINNLNYKNILKIYKTKKRGNNRIKISTKRKLKHVGNSRINGIIKKQKNNISRNNIKNSHKKINYIDMFCQINKDPKKAFKANGNNNKDNPIQRNEKNNAIYAFYINAKKRMQIKNTATNSELLCNKNCKNIYYIKRNSVTELTNSSVHEQDQTNLNALLQQVNGTRNMCFRQNDGNRQSDDNHNEINKNINKIQSDDNNKGGNDENAFNHDKIDNTNNEGNHNGSNTNGGGNNNDGNNNDGNNNDGKNNDGNNNDGNNSNGDDNNKDSDNEKDSHDNDKGNESESSEEGNDKIKKRKSASVRSNSTAYSSVKSENSKSNYGKRKIVKSSSASYENDSIIFNSFYDEMSCFYPNNSNSFICSSSDTDNKEKYEKICSYEKGKERKKWKEVERNMNDEAEDEDRHRLNYIENIPNNGRVVYTNDINNNGNVKANDKIKEGIEKQNMTYFTRRKKEYENRKRIAEKLRKRIRSEQEIETKLRGNNIDTKDKHIEKDTNIAKMVKKKAHIGEIHPKWCFPKCRRNSLEKYHRIKEKRDSLNLNNKIDISEKRNENIFSYSEYNMLLLKKTRENKNDNPSKNDIIYHINTITNVNKKMKVVIIGGGMSGLSAAYILQNNNIDVVIYEARNRLGGKYLYSPKSYKKSFLGEVDFYVNRNNPLINFCLKKNIYNNNINSHLYKHYIYYNNKKIYTYKMRNEFFKLIKKLRSFYEHISNTKYFNDPIIKKQFLYASFGEVINSEINKIKEQKHQIKKKKHFKTYIYVKLYMSLIESVCGIKIYSLSIQYIFHNLHYLDIFKNICCTFELSKIIKKLKKNVKIKKNKIVNKIYSYNDHIKLSFENYVDTRLYDYCIVTVPIGVLKDSIKFYDGEGGQKKECKNEKKDSSKKVDLDNCKKRHMNIKDQKNDTPYGEDDPKNSIKNNNVKEGDEIDEKRKKKHEIATTTSCHDAKKNSKDSVSDYHDADDVSNIKSRKIKCKDLPNPKKETSENHENVPFINTEKEKTAINKGADYQTNESSNNLQSMSDDFIRNIEVTTNENKSVNNLFSSISASLYTSPGKNVSSTNNNGYGGNNENDENIFSSDNEFNHNKNNDTNCSISTKSNQNVNISNNYIFDNNMIGNVNKSDTMENKPSKECLKKPKCAESNTHFNYKNEKGNKHSNHNNTGEMVEINNIIESFEKENRYDQLGNKINTEKMSFNTSSKYLPNDNNNNNHNKYYSDKNNNTEENINNKVVFSSNNSKIKKQMHNGKVNDIGTNTIDCNAPEDKKGKKENKDDDKNKAEKKLEKKLEKKGNVMKDRSKKSNHIGLIEFIPKLPDWKINSIKRLGVSTNNKIIITLKKRIVKSDQNVTIYFNQDKKNSNTYTMKNTTERNLLKNDANVNLFTNDDNEKPSITKLYAQNDKDNAPYFFDPNSFLNDQKIPDQSIIQENDKKNLDNLKSSKTEDCINCLNELFSFNNSKNNSNEKEQDNLSPCLKNLESKTTESNVHSFEQLMSTDNTNNNNEIKDEVREWNKSMQCKNVNEKANEADDTITSRYNCTNVVNNQRNFPKESSLIKYLKQEHLLDDNDKEHKMCYTNEMCMNKYSHIIFYSAEPIIALYFKSKYSKEVNKIKKKDMKKKKVINDCAYFLKNMIPQIQIDKIYFYDWTNNKFSRGLNSYFKKKSLIIDKDIISFPVNRLLFAGEHTHSNGCNSIVDSYLSGKREAYRIIEKVNKTIYMDKLTKCFYTREENYSNFKKFIDDDSFADTKVVHPDSCQQNVSVSMENKGNLSHMTNSINTQLLFPSINTSLTATSLAIPSIGSVVTSPTEKSLVSKVAPFQLILDREEMVNHKEIVIRNINTNSFMYLYDDEVIGLTDNEYDSWHDNIRCIFCNQLQTINNYFIGIIRLKHISGKYLKYTCHKGCLYYNNYIFNHAYGNRYFNISVMFNYLFQKKCSVCLMNFPSMKCSIYNCKNFVHLKCANNYLSWPNLGKTSRHESLYCYKHQYMHGIYHNYYEHGTEYYDNDSMLDDEERMLRIKKKRRNIKRKLQKIKQMKEMKGIIQIKGVKYIGETTNHFNKLCLFNHISDGNNIRDTKNLNGISNELNYMGNDNHYMNELECMDEDNRMYHLYHINKNASYSFDEVENPCRKDWNISKENSKLYERYLAEKKRKEQLLSKAKIDENEKSITDSDQMSDDITDDGEDYYNDVIYSRQVEKKQKSKNGKNLCNLFHDGIMQSNCKNSMKPRYYGNDENFPNYANWENQNIYKESYDGEKISKLCLKDERQFKRFRSSSISTTTATISSSSSNNVRTIKIGQLTDNIHANISKFLKYYQNKNNSNNSNSSSNFYSDISSILKSENYVNNNLLKYILKKYKGIFPSMNTQYNMMYNSYQHENGAGKNVDKTLLGYSDFNKDIYRLNQEKLMNHYYLFDENNSGNNNICVNTNEGYIKKQNNNYVGICPPYQYYGNNVIEYDDSSFMNGVKKDCDHHILNKGALSYNYNDNKLVGYSSEDKHSRIWKNDNYLNGRYGMKRDYNSYYDDDFYDNYFNYGTDNYMDNYYEGNYMGGVQRFDSSYYQKLKNAKNILHSKDNLSILKNIYKKKEKDIIKDDKISSVNINNYENKQNNNSQFRNSKKEDFAYYYNRNKQMNTIGNYVNRMGYENDIYNGHTYYPSDHEIYRIGKNFKEGNKTKRSKEFTDRGNDVRYGYGYDTNKRDNIRNDENIKLNQTEKIEYNNKNINFVDKQNGIRMRRRIRSDSKININHNRNEVGGGDGKHNIGQENNYASYQTYINEDILKDYFNKCDQCNFENLNKEHIIYKLIYNYYNNIKKMKPNLINNNNDPYNQRKQTTASINNLINGAQNKYIVSDYEKNIIGGKQFDKNDMNKINSVINSGKEIPQSYLLNDKMYEASRKYINYRNRKGMNTGKMLDSVNINMTNNLNMHNNTGLRPQEYSECHFADPHMKQNDNNLMEPCLDKKRLNEIAANSSRNIKKKNDMNAIINTLNEFPDMPLSYKEAILNSFYKRKNMGDDGINGLSGGGMISGSAADSTVSDPVSNEEPNGNLYKTLYGKEVEKNQGTMMNKQKICQLLRAIDLKKKDVVDYKKLELLYKIYFENNNANLDSNNNNVNSNVNSNSNNGINPKWKNPNQQIIQNKLLENYYQGLSGNLQQTECNTEFEKRKRKKQMSKEGKENISNINYNDNEKLNMSKQRETEANGIDRSNQLLIASYVKNGGMNMGINKGKEKGHEDGTEHHRNSDEFFHIAKGKASCRIKQETKTNEYFKNNNDERNGDYTNSHILYDNLIKNNKLGNVLNMQMEKLTSDIQNDQKMRVSDNDEIKNMKNYILENNLNKNKFIGKERICSQENISNIFNPNFSENEKSLVNGPIGQTEQASQNDKKKKKKKNVKSEIPQNIYPTVKPYVHGNSKKSKVMNDKSLKGLEMLDNMIYYMRMNELKNLNNSKFFNDLNIKDKQNFFSIILNMKNKHMTTTSDSIDINQKGYETKYDNIYSMNDTTSINNNEKKKIQKKKQDKLYTSKNMNIIPGYANSMWKENNYDDFNYDYKTIPHSKNISEMIDMRDDVCNKLHEYPFSEFDHNAYDVNYRNNMFNGQKERNQNTTDYNQVDPINANENLMGPPNILDSKYNLRKKKMSKNSSLHRKEQAYSKNENEESIMDLNLNGEHSGFPSNLLLKPEQKKAEIYNNSNSNNNNSNSNSNSNIIGGMPQNMEMMQKHNLLPLDYLGMRKRQRIKKKEPLQKNFKIKPVPISQMDEQINSESNGEMSDNIGMSTTSKYPIPPINNKNNYYNVNNLNYKEYNNSQLMDLNLEDQIKLTDNIYKKYKKNDTLSDNTDDDIQSNLNQFKKRKRKKDIYELIGDKYDPNMKLEFQNRGMAMTHAYNDNNREMNKLTRHHSLLLPEEDEEDSNSEENCTKSDRSNFSAPTNGIKNYNNRNKVGMDKVGMDKVGIDKELPKLKEFVNMNKKKNMELEQLLKLLRKNKNIQSNYIDFPQKKKKKIIESQVANSGDENKMGEKKKKKKWEYNSRIKEANYLDFLQDYVEAGDSTSVRHKNSIYNNGDIKQNGVINRNIYNKKVNHNSGSLEERMHNNDIDNHDMKDSYMKHMLRDYLKGYASTLKNTDTNIFKSGALHDGKKEVAIKKKMTMDSDPKYSNISSNSQTTHSSSGRSSESSESGNHEKYNGNKNNDINNNNNNVEEQTHYNYVNKHFPTFIPPNDRMFNPLNAHSNKIGEATSGNSNEVNVVGNGKIHEKNNYPINKQQDPNNKYEKNGNMNLMGNQATYSIIKYNLTKNNLINNVLSDMKSNLSQKNIFKNSSNTAPTTNNNYLNITDETQSMQNFHKKRRKL